MIYPLVVRFGILNMTFLCRMVRYASSLVRVFRPSTFRTSPFRCTYGPSSMPSNSQMVIKNGDASHGIRDKIINKANPNKQTGSSSGINFHPINKQVYPGKTSIWVKKHQQKNTWNFLSLPKTSRLYVYIYI